MRLPNTHFFAAHTVDLTTADGPPREAFVYMFRSPLGSELQHRSLTEVERFEIRETCINMHNYVIDEGAEPFDDYWVEFFDGQEEDPFEIPPERRFIVGYGIESDFQGDPVVISLS